MTGEAQQIRDECKFGHVAIGRLPNIFGFHVTVEWDVTRSGVRVTIFDTDWEPVCRITDESKEVGFDGSAEPLPCDAVLAVLWPLHVGVTRGDWLEHPPTVVWECADHDDIAWAGPAEVDRATRAKIEAVASQRLTDRAGEQGEE
ncbi:hypothetical protein FGW37_05475 [Streptomyces rectiverticillatus]|uniref:hypothetical protein n=1 Tax=Streptomyces rectiverticillatus TaxID=173860 RepID=UPI0015C3F6FF|nr:hypothetical protein [Streptomyces rectiverticillatus]QLE71126.1 hypothetical protein FGW37_05475 [Streptomyces rectiverticillatus]